MEIAAEDEAQSAPSVQKRCVGSFSLLAWEIINFYVTLAGCFWRILWAGLEFMCQQLYWLAVYIQLSTTKIAHNCKTDS
jgi:hypothetical protein